MKFFPAACLAFCILFSWSANSYGQFDNGDFEDGFYGTGLPRYWKANTVAGSENLQDITHLSPFTNVYPPSADSIRLTGGIATTGVPANLVQGFTSESGQFKMSFEFSLEAVSDAAWRLRIGESSKPNFDLLINAAGSLQFVGSTNTTIAALTPGTWYQFTAIVDDAAHTISGSLKPFGGTSAFFSGSLYLDGYARTEDVEFSDFSPNENPLLYVDNVAFRQVPEPSTVCLLIAGLILLGVVRCSRFETARTSGA